MAINSSSTSRSGFIIKRPLITSNGFTNDLDATIKKQLEELNTLLSKSVFSSVANAVEVPTDEEADNMHYRGLKKATKRTAAAASTPTPRLHKKVVLDLQDALHLHIYAKKTELDEIWKLDGLLYSIAHTKVSADAISIADYIDQDKDLSNLKYEYQEYLTDNWNFLSVNYKAILAYQGITDYLLVYAYLIKGISDVNALHNFIINRKDGLTTIINYGVISATRSIIQKEAINIHPVIIKGEPYTYNDDEHPLIQKIIHSNLSLSSFSFSKEVNKIIDFYIHNGAEMKLILQADIGEIPKEYIPLLIKYIKNSPVPITPKNVDSFLPMFIGQIKNSAAVAATSDSIEEEEIGEENLEVVYFDEDQSTTLANVSNVRRAAKLFYSMVVGEEMEVFQLIDYLSKKYLVKNRVDIQDARLLKNIQRYVYSDKFIDLETGEMHERTMPEERQMFYRQVFDIGNGRVSEDMIVNSEFSGLWKTLILETDSYIEKAAASPNPDSFVSRQNVMQAVEELQYNLSENSSIMASALVPVIYAELEFIIRKIFMHPEIIRQIVPSNGTWTRVIEALYANMKQKRINAKVVYNKAKLSHSIIEKIANYNPAEFEQDKAFSAFISEVSALISTQSIIQESAKKERMEYAGHENKNQEEDYEPSNSYKTAQPAKAGNDEWDF
jgi:hypothetical protein